jgi:dTDP-L-rhamnose 4-epimerase
MKRILITGGGGFIGSHLADELLARGYHVRALDKLSPQVHGSATRPPYLDPEVELQIGDVANPDDVQRALRDIDAVFHLAAAVGVGQSMYEIENYTRANNIGTAVLLEALAKRPVDKLIVASSMSLYGEGLYTDHRGQPQEAALRSREQLEANQWDLLDSEGQALQPLPTPESKLPNLASVYALSKFDQEKMSLLVGDAYGIPVVALRFFNVYGTRQALSNPYTGVMAIFASRLLNNKAPQIFEDGHQRRDFVHVRDIVQACRLALEAAPRKERIFNIGSGRSISILEVADEIAKALGKKGIRASITRRYRVGDIRHCFADISLAEKLLAYKPSVAFDEGVRELAAWLDGQIAEDRVSEAHGELLARGLAY